MSDKSDSPSTMAQHYLHNPTYDPLIQVIDSERRAAPRLDPAPSAQVKAIAHKIQLLEAKREALAKKISVLTQKLETHHFYMGRDNRLSASGSHPVYVASEAKWRGLNEAVRKFRIKQILEPDVKLPPEILELLK